jgi:hypothetical protein
VRFPTDFHSETMQGCWCDGIYRAKERKSWEKIPKKKWGYSKINKLKTFAVSSTTLQATLMKGIWMVRNG